MGNSGSGSSSSSSSRCHSTIGSCIRKISRKHHKHSGNETEWNENATTSTKNNLNMYQQTTPPVSPVPNNKLTKQHITRNRATTHNTSQHQILTNERQHAKLIDKTHRAITTSSTTATLTSTSTSPTTPTPASPTAAQAVPARRKRHQHQH